MEWNWPPADEGRRKRAKSVKFREIFSDDDSPQALAIGSGSEDYEVSLLSCTCADFGISGARHDSQPCKHMIALAMKAGILNENGLTPDQQRTEDIASLRSQIATAYGYYYCFKVSVISDTEYDTMKSRLNELQQSSNA